MTLVCRILRISSLDTLYYFRAGPIISDLALRAVGSTSRRPKGPGFGYRIKAKLGAKAIGRRELENNEGYELKEPQSPYNRAFDPQKCSLRLKNDHIWQVS